MKQITNEKVFAFINSCAWSETWQQWRFGGVVVHVQGEACELLMQDQWIGLEDWSGCLPDCQETGLMVFDGQCVNYWLFNGGHHDDPDLQGIWRRPTAVELWELRQPLKLELTK